LGLSEGGSLGALFAATYPNRCRALILYGAFAKFSSWFPTEEAFAQFLGYVDQAWGSGGAASIFVPSRANDPAFQKWFARFERLGGSPASVKSYMLNNSQIDISDILPMIRVPTRVIHRTQDVISVEGGRYLAKHIPGARYLELPGSDHPPMIGDNANDGLHTGECEMMGDDVGGIAAHRRAGGSACRCGRGPCIGHSQRPCGGLRFALRSPRQSIPQGGSRRMAHLHRRAVNTIAIFQR
jgi:hypothetical protein